jgi:hypothetical protein
MSWNYRIVKVVEKYDNNDEEITLEIAEVYYNRDGTPLGYSRARIMCSGDEGEMGLAAEYERMKEAFTKPVLLASEMCDININEENDYA